jgi:hypothetical protein
MGVLCRERARQFHMTGTVRQISSMLRFDCP